MGELQAHYTRAASEMKKKNCLYVVHSFRLGGCPRWNLSKPGKQKARLLVPVGRWKARIFFSFSVRKSPGVQVALLPFLQLARWCFLILVFLIVLSVEHLALESCNLSAGLKSDADLIQALIPALALEISLWTHLFHAHPFSYLYTTSKYTAQIQSR